MNHGREKLVSIKSAFLTIFLVLSLLLPAVLAEEGEWSQYRNDNIRSGVSNLTSNIVAPKVKWSFETQDRVKSPPTVADINGDGQFEVVFGSDDGHLFVLDRYGSELWNYPVNGPIINQPTIGDVDADGEMEVVFGGFYHYTGDPYLYVLNGNSGTLLWDFESGNPTDIHKGFQASPLLYDITGDGALDVLIGSMDYYFYAFDGITGAIIWKSDIFQHFVRASSPLDDIDKNGEMDVVVVDNHAEVRLYDAKTGALKWSQDIGHGVEATPVLADVDGDNFHEIILFTIGEGNISGDAVVLNHDGSELWRSSVHTYFYTSPTVIDIDGDGLLDIIGGDSNDHEIVAYKGTNGAILWETPLPDSIWSQAPLDLADIDSDGEIEVIAGAAPNLYCLNAISGAIEWKFTTSDHIWGQPAIADLEKDGLAEILFGCYDNFLYVLENEFKPPVAEAGENQIINEGETAFFNGSESSASLGDVISYSWDFNNFEDKDSDGNPTNDDESNDPITSHTYGDNGNFTVTLTVTSQVTGMVAEDTCIVTVLNVAPDLNVGEPKMEVEIGLRVAGSKWSNIALTLFEDNVKVGYLEVERWPGSPDNNPIYSNPTLPASLDLLKSYKAVVTYDPYPDLMDEIRGDQPNNGKDSKDNAANPVWLSVRFADGSEETLHHIFNTQQSKIKNSPHKNHIEPWEVDISSLFFGHSFELTVHETDPGSDDLTFTYLYNSQGSTFINLNDPPNPDPFPSPEVNPMDIYTIHTIQYDGPGTMTLTVTDDDGGTTVTTLYIP